MSSGTTIKEIQRFFEYLKQSKTNNEMTIIITNNMCKDLQDMIENLCNYKDLLKQKINKAIELIKKAILERDITGNGTLNLNELLETLEAKDE